MAHFPTHRFSSVFAPFSIGLLTVFHRFYRFPKTAGNVNLTPLAARQYTHLTPNRSDRRSRNEFRPRTALVISGGDF